MGELGLAGGVWTVQGLAMHVGMQQLGLQQLEIRGLGMRGLGMQQQEMKGLGMRGVRGLRM